MTLGRRRVLVVDDKPTLRDSIRRALSLEGFEVDTAENGIDALEKIASLQPGLVVLDVLMPELDGLELCRRLRMEGNSVPVLLLTVRDRVSDRVAGLDAGADDYLVKPFALEELMARVRALLRRSHTDGTEQVTSFEGIRVDPATRQAWSGDHPLELSRTEFDLLAFFLDHPRHVLTRELVMDRVWGFDPGPASNTLAVYVGYLRRKLEAHGQRRMIQTVRGVGYVLREP